MADVLTILKVFVIKSRRQIKEEDAATLLLIEGIDPMQEWDPNNVPKPCIFYKILLTELEHDKYFGLKSVSEGGFSMSFDAEQKRSALYDIARESGCEALIQKYQPDNIIEDKSYLW